MAPSDVGAMPDDNVNRRIADTGARMGPGTAAAPGGNCLAARRMLVIERRDRNLSKEI
jgi:hypothetical protein